MESSCATSRLLSFLSWSVFEQCIREVHRMRRRRLRKVFLAFCIASSLLVITILIEITKALSLRSLRRRAVLTSYYFLEIHVARASWLGCHRKKMTSLLAMAATCDYQIACSLKRSKPASKCVAQPLSILGKVARWSELREDCSLLHLHFSHLPSSISVS
jgi:hypothetical protein